MSRASLVLLLLLAASCAQKKPAPAAAAKAIAAPPRMPVQTLKGPRQPGVVARLEPIATDEVRALLPAPAGARQVQALAHASVGERIEAGWCYDAGSLADLGGALVKQYAAAGWQDVAIHPNPNLPDRVTLTARKPPYVLYGSLARAGRADCAGPDGKTFVSLGVHHVEAIASPGTAGTQGTAGLRTP